jgi:hypothetical protein
MLNLHFVGRNKILSHAADLRHSDTKSTIKEPAAARALVSGAALPIIDIDDLASPYFSARRTVAAHPCSGGRCRPEDCSDL